VNQSTRPAGAIGVAQALRAAQAAGVERLDAQLILAALLDRPRSWLIAHDDALLSPAQSDAWQALSERRAAGEPLAYVLGQKEFHGLLLRVDPRVLIPRADTELLVDWACELSSGSFGMLECPALVDLGTGSGAIALAVKQSQPRVRMTATDISDDALAVARANANRLNLDIEFLAGSWWAPLQNRRFDLVLSNPPYIAGGDPHLAALHHEPSLALTPSGDGLDALRAVVGGAAAHLQPAGWLLLEHGHDQASALRHLLSAHGFEAIGTRRDLAGQERCTGGRSPTSDRT
jgi:release factor glutamine methyltransferase